MENNIRTNKINNFTIQTKSGLYEYLKRNQETYNLEGFTNLQKSKVDFLLDNLSNISENQSEINVMGRYLYYIRLMRRLFKENPIGDYELRTCKYKNEEHDKVVLLLLIYINNKKFYYILPDNEEKFSEISLLELKEKIQDKNNPLQIYHRPYRNQTGPLTQDDSKKIYDDTSRN